MELGAPHLPLQQGGRWSLVPSQVSTLSSSDLPGGCKVGVVKAREYRTPAVWGSWEHRDPESRRDPCPFLLMNPFLGLKRKVVASVKTCFGFEISLDWMQWKQESNGQPTGCWRFWKSTKGREKLSMGPHAPGAQG